MNRTQKIVLAVAAPTALVLSGATAGVAFAPGHTTTVTRTVRQPPKVIKVTVTRTQTVTRWRTRTVYAAPAAPSPAPVQTLPPGVTRAPGGYYVDCWKAQCTSLPGAGPFGTTCLTPSAGVQLCQ